MGNRHGHFYRPGLEVTSMICTHIPLAETWSDHHTNGQGWLENIQDLGSQKEKKLSEQSVIPAILAISLGLKLNSLFLFFKHTRFIPTAGCTQLLHLPGSLHNWLLLIIQTSAQMLPPQRGLSWPPNLKWPLLTSYFLTYPPFQFHQLHQHLNQSCCRGRT